MEIDFSSEKTNFSDLLIINYDQNKQYSFIEDNFKNHDYSFVSMSYMIIAFKDLFKDSLKKINEEEIEKLLLTNEKLFFKIFLVLNYGSNCLINHNYLNYYKGISIYHHRINKLCDIKYNIILFKNNEDFQFSVFDIKYLISDIVYYDNSKEYLTKLINYFHRNFSYNKNDYDNDFFVELIGSILMYMFENYVSIEDNSMISLENNFISYERFNLYKSFFNVKYSPIYIDYLLEIFSENSLLKTLKSLENQIIFIEKLGYHHKEALYVYTRHGDQIINNYLRNVKYSFNKDNNYLLEVDSFDEINMYEEIKLFLLKYLEEIFKFIPKTTEPIQLFRNSMFVYPEKYSNINYISTSIYPEYIKHMRGKLYTFNIKSGTSLIPLMTISHFDEGEVLINKNSELTCDSNNCYMFSKKLIKKSIKKSIKKKSIKKKPIKKKSIKKITNQ